MRAPPEGNSTLSPSRPLSCSPPKPGWNGDINIGVFVVRNTEMGRQLMTDWIGRFNPMKWSRRSDGTVECEGCVWAGEEFEQGAFAKHILDNHRYCDHIGVLREGLVNYNGNEAFFKHWPGSLKGYIPEYLQQRQARVGDVPAVMMINGEDDVPCDEDVEENSSSKAEAGGACKKKKKKKTVYKEEWSE